MFFVGGWIITSILVLRTRYFASLRRAPFLIFSTLLVINNPALSAGIAYGNTSVIAALLVNLYFLSLTQQWHRLIPALFLGLAIFIKPQLAVIGLGILVALVHRTIRERKLNLENFKFVVALGVVSICIFVVPLLVPGGMNMDTYTQFFTKTLPSLTNPAEQPKNTLFGFHSLDASPIALVLTILLGFGVSSSAYAALALLTGAVLLGLWIFLSVYWKIDQAIFENSIFWALLSVFISSITWAHYAGWLIVPMFFAIKREAEGNVERVEKTALIVLGAALLRTNVAPLHLVCLIGIAVITVLEMRKNFHIRSFVGDKGHSVSAETA